MTTTDFACNACGKMVLRAEVVDFGAMLIFCDGCATALIAGGWLERLERTAFRDKVTVTREPIAAKRMDA